jgi:predicted CopG family antitoxin
MAVKTITIDMAAYELLSAEKRGNESFSKVIKRRLKPARTARRLLDSLPDCVVSEEALGHMDEVVVSRTDSPAMSPVLDAGEG